MADTLTRALDRAIAELKRTATELGAESVAVLVNTDQRVEVNYPCGGSPTDAPDGQFLSLPGSRHEALFHAEGAVDAGTPMAELLRETVSRHANSFLLHPWKIDRRAVTVVFGFVASTVPAQRVPALSAESLDLAGLATWSAREITRLRSELRGVNGRLAGRKLVERAKGFLQVERGITEEVAYEYLRGQSRRRRISLTKLAEEVVRIRGGFDRSQLNTRGVVGRSQGL